MGCDGIFDRLTNLEVQELAWKTIEECKSRFATDAQQGYLTVHQICGRVVDALMQNAAREKSFDNLTIVMVAFKGLLDYLSKKDHLLTDVSTINENSKNIKIQEGGSALANSLDSINHNQSNQNEKPLVLKKS
jgi:serine/threonine protein phosphatase PrpC